MALGEKNHLDYSYYLSEERRSSKRWGGSSQGLGLEEMGSRQT